MYLKSLTLKGFKSFADKAVLALEPGITAVVGPNGSGKSNISDAVLWVLGERSAKNLRGQAMEDIIFSGSAARKAVSVAEVELVLDNSDGTLPVDYDEVAITRRMYRNGESEYLINGVLSRRLDVQDILHDTGLGTGTHSIISQGSLDSILQSKPEDRRALIEEAAGVLKHKQRKEKSARKLAAMDNHLARVKDVAAEVGRQLGPLERKAKRAQAYQRASAELATLRLQIAVDDLRRLKDEWDKVIEAERLANAEVEQRKGAVAAAEQKVNDVQDLIARESQDAGELARKQRRAVQVAERLDSVEMLVRERRRQALGSQTDIQMTIDGAAARKVAATGEVQQAARQLDEARESLGVAQSQVEQLSKERFQAAEARRAISSQIEDVTRDMRVVQATLEDANKRLTSLRESLSNGMARETLAQARRSEIAGEVDRATTESDRAQKASEQARDELAAIEERERQAQQELARALEEQTGKRAERDAAEEDVRVRESEIKALKNARKAISDEDPALAWLLENAERFSGNMKPVAQMLGAPTDLETLVEQVLGDDVAALSVDADSEARAIAQALGQGDRAGDVSLVMREDAGAARARARMAGAGTPLVDVLSFDDRAASTVEALLGDVVVCATRDEAFEAHRADTKGLRFVSRDGCIVYPGGKVRVFGKRHDESEGVLARERRLNALAVQLEDAQKRADAAREAVLAAEGAYRAAQAESLHVSQQLASQKGVAAAAEAEARRAAEKLSTLVRESEDMERQLEAAKSTVSNLRPDVEATEKLIQDTEAERVALQQRIEELQRQLEPARETAAGLSEKLNEAKLSEASLNERATYARRMAEARQRDLDAIEIEVREAKRLLALKEAAGRRTDPLLEVLASVGASLAKRAGILDEALAAQESSTTSIHAAAAASRDEARRAHDAFEEANAKMAQVRVDKGRLEVQVEAAATTVIRDCGTPLDHIDEVPVLEDRQAAEDELFKLERRIKNMGTINPDAAEEYEQLKQRYDYLAGQITDMETARKSLGRIVRIIDARMKDDFVRTFDQVNANFSEIFELLFPGGSAHLSLVDPDDVENSGVEVHAQPRGKRIAKMMLMSGGEKSLTALALLFAVYRIRSTPFYILDEVEAALDDTNLRRLVGYIDTLRASTQLIMITHQRRTMEMADVLFGVSMQADGVTKVVSQKLERALEQAE